MAGDPTIIDMLELVINRLIDTTPEPPTITPERAHEQTQRTLYADAVTTWSHLLGKRFRAAKDLCEAVGVKVPYTVKTLDEMLGVLPSKTELGEDDI